MNVVFRRLRLVFLSLFVDLLIFFEIAGYRRLLVVQVVVAYAYLFAILQFNNLRYSVFNIDWYVIDVEDFRIRAQTTRGFCDNGCRVGVVEYLGIW